MRKKSLIISLLLSTTLAFGIDIGGLMQSAVDVTSQTDKSSTNTKTKNSNLSDNIVSSGLKEALQVGVEYGVKELGAKDGYLKNAKIPLPKNLQKVESLVRKAGGGKIADDLIMSMNNAATKAAPKTAVIFADAIEKMTLDDAKTILAGDKNAATDYFQKNTNSSLQKMISPIIKESMQENKVATYYDSFNKYYKSNAKDFVENSKVMGYAKQFGVDSYLPDSDKDIDAYVTDKAIHGLFKMIAKKESEIRTDSLAQTTSLLKQVFGN